MSNAVYDNLKRSALGAGVASMVLFISTHAQAGDGASGLKLPITAKRESATWTIDAQGNIHSQIRYSAGSGSGSKKYASGLVVVFANGEILSRKATKTVGRPFSGTNRGEKNQDHAPLPIGMLRQIKSVHVNYETGSSGPSTIKEWIETASVWVEQGGALYAKYGGGGGDGDGGRSAASKVPPLSNHFRSMNRRIMKAF